VWRFWSDEVSLLKPSARIKGLSLYPNVGEGRGFVLWHFAGINRSVCRAMSGTTIELPETTTEKEVRGDPSLEPGYLVVCWNDPVNLMDYVTRVFRKVFGWPKAKAERHMMQVHQDGKSVLVRESLERAEHYVHQLHRHHLHATMERDQ
jgi:ATP-dependent Clp protease adaptor protein ClpS